MIDDAAETTRVRDIRGMAREQRTGDPGALMKPAPESSTQEVLAGLVERVTFHNPESGFCVLRANARGYRDLVPWSATPRSSPPANGSTIAPTVSR